MTIVDLHTHTLYGIDDGAQTIDDSIELLKKQKTLGVQLCVLTPHFKYRDDQSYDSFLSLRDQQYRQLKQKILPIPIRLGAEVYYSSQLAELDLKPLCIEETDYLLIEFSTRMKPQNLYSVMNDIVSMGYKPIIAHIERYPYFREDFKVMMDLVALGIGFQINAATIIDKTDESFVKACFKHQLVHLIASDSHNLDKRPPNLTEAYELIGKKHGQAVCDKLINNAVSVINNQELDLGNPTIIKSLWGKYF